MRMEWKIKGAVSRDGYFFEGLNILISTFYRCAAAFYYHIQVFICFFEITYSNKVENAYWIRFSVIGRCSLVPTYGCRENVQRINFSQAASNMILQNQRSKLKLWVWFFHQLSNKKYTPIVKCRLQYDGRNAWFVLNCLNKPESEVSLFCQMSSSVWWS